MKFYFTPVEVDLIVTCIQYAQCDMNRIVPDSTIGTTCKRYCNRRVAEVLEKFCGAQDAKPVS